jgi:hypothetical protein
MRSMPGLPASVDRVVFEGLRERYEAGQLVVFAGAGVSRAAGLPTWPELAGRLVDRMVTASAPAEEIAAARRHAAKGDLIRALSVSEHVLQNEFYLAVEAELDDRQRGAPVPDVAKAIAALGPKLAGVLTTNLDTLLERAFEGSWPSTTKPVADVLTGRRKLLFKPHGTLAEPDTWVFVRKQYERAMFGRADLQSAFAALCRARSMLFVGTSLTDANLQKVLSEIRAEMASHPPMHFAILSGPVDRDFRQELGEAGIRLLVYENKSGSHREVVDILRALSAVQVQPPTAPTGVASVRGAPSPNSPARGAAPASPPAPTSAAAASSTAAPPSPLTGTVVGPVDVYISAAPADEKYVSKLAGHFQLLEKVGVVRVAHAGHVRPGEDRKKVMSSLLARAKIILPMLSADYSNAPEQEQELAAALKRSDTGTAVVIPILARPCMWKLSLGDRHLKALPANEKALSSSASVDDALLEVVSSVGDEASRLRKKGP